MMVKFTPPAHQLMIGCSSSHEHTRGPGISRQRTGDLVLAPPTRISAEKRTSEEWKATLGKPPFAVFKLKDGCDKQCSRSRIGSGCVSVHHSSCTGSGVSALPLSKIIWEWLQSAKRRGDKVIQTITL